MSLSREGPTRLPAFEPAQFATVCDHRVEAWSPGREIRLVRPMGFGLIGALPFVVAGFSCGPVYFLLDRSGEPLLGRLISAGALALLGIIVGSIALAPLVAGVPRQVVFDWVTRTVTISGWFHRRTLPFTDFAAIELRCLIRGTRKRNRWNYYSCEINAGSSDPGATAGPSVKLVATRTFPDPDTPRHHSLLLAGELAEALGVPLRVVEYT